MQIIMPHPNLLNGQHRRELNSLFKQALRILMHSKSEEPLLYVYMGLSLFLNILYFLKQF